MMSLNVINISHVECQLSPFTILTFCRPITEVDVGVDFIIPRNSENIEKKISFKKGSKVSPLIKSQFIVSEMNSV